MSEISTEWPQWFYHADGRKRLFKSAAEVELAEDGWKTYDEHFGIKKEEPKAEPEPEPEPDEVSPEAEEPKRGRKKKAQSESEGENANIERFF